MGFDIHTHTHTHTHTHSQDVFQKGKLERARLKESRGHRDGQYLYLVFTD